MKDSAEKRGFRWWVRWYLRASYTLMWGLLLTTQGSEWLLQDRFSSVLWPWRGTIRLAAFLSTLWMLWALWPREESEAEKSWAGVLLLWAVSFGVLTWQREHGWAVVGTSVENRAVFGVVGKASPAISHISHRRLESRRTRRVRPPMVERTAV